jgi:hypothetical protein
VVVPSVAANASAPHDQLIASVVISVASDGVPPAIALDGRPLTFEGRDDAIGI